MLADLIRLFIWLIIALIPTAIISIVSLYVFTDVYIKKKVRGATLAVFFSQTKEETSELVRVGDDTSFTMGGDPDDPENPTYLIDPEKQLFRYWPPAFPRWIQQRVPTYYFKVDEPTAIDPTRQKSHRIISPKMLSGIVNERLLKMSIKDAREQAEGDLRSHRKLPVYMMIGIAVTLVMVILNFVFIIITNSAVGEIRRVVTNS